MRKYFLLITSIVLVIVGAIMKLDVVGKWYLILLICGTVGFIFSIAKLISAKK